MELLSFLCLGAFCSCGQNGGEKETAKEAVEALEVPGEATPTNTGEESIGAAEASSPKAVTLLPGSPGNAAQPAEAEAPVSGKPKSPPRQLSDFSDWSASQLEEHYWERISDLEGGQIAEFEIDVLGAWCEQDVESCFSSLEENLEEAVAWQAKRNAAQGWAERNWVGAYEWYQTSGGDVGGLAKLGGDAKGLIESLFRKMAEEDLDGATEAVNYFLEEEHREIALRVLEEFPSSE